MKNQSQLLTIKHACELLGVTESWLRHQIFERKIPYIKVGRLIRFDEQDLINWICINKKVASNV